MKTGISARRLKENEIQGIIRTRIEANPSNPCEKSWVGLSKVEKDNAITGNIIGGQTAGGQARVSPPSPPVSVSTHMSHQGHDRQHLFYFQAYLRSDQVTLAPDVDSSSKWTSLLSGNPLCLASTEWKKEKKFMTVKFNVEAQYFTLA